MARLDLSRIIGAIRDVAVGNRRARVIAAHIADAIPTRGTVLDAACGDGAVALALVQLRPDLVVVGADGPVRPDARIAVTPHDGIRIPYADGAFDYVLLVDRLLGFGDPAAFLAEAARVSRQGVVLKDQLGDGVLALPSLRLLQLVAGDAPARVDQLCFARQARQWAR